MKRMLLYDCPICSGHVCWSRGDQRSGLERRISKAVTYFSVCSTPVRVNGEIERTWYSDASTEWADRRIATKDRRQS